MKSIGGLGLSVVGVGAFMASFALAPMVGIPLALVSIPATYKSLKLFTDGVTGNCIKHSMFATEANKKIKFNGNTEKVDFISQNFLSLGETINFLNQKDKQETFRKSTFDLFTKLPKEKNNKNIKYGCESQAETLFLLKTLNKMGYITNFEYEKSRKSSLIVEKLMFGEKPNFKKKYQMYMMKFEMTDKKINYDEVMEKLMPKKTEIKPNDNTQKQSIILANEKVKEIENAKEMEAKLNKNNEINYLKNLKAEYVNKQLENLENKQLNNDDEINRTR